jgi:excisionase family DNA binding protein
MNKPLLRVGEAADVLAVSRWTIYRWVEDGRLEGTKIGRGSLRVFRASLDRLVQNSKTQEVNSTA